MKKKVFRRLHLQRETLHALQEPGLPALLQARGGASNNSEGPQNYCCSTVTSPPLNTSGACEPRTDACPCSTGPG